MINNVIPGNLMRININGMDILCELNCDFAFTCDMLPTSSVISGGWSEYIEGLKSWSINLDSHTLFSMLDGASIDTVLNAFINGLSMDIVFGTQAGATPAFNITGKVRVASGGISGALNSVSIWNTSLVGTGPFTPNIEGTVKVLQTDENNLLDTNNGELLQLE